MGNVVVVVRMAGAAFGLGPEYRVDAMKDKGAFTEIRASLAEPGGRECPACRAPMRVHGHRERTVYCAPNQGKPLVARLDMRRLRCPSCGRTMWERQPALSTASPHLSRGCEAYIAKRIAERATLAQVTRECGASEAIVAKAVPEQPGCRRLPERLCVDEVRAFKKDTAIAGGLPHMVTCLYDGRTAALLDVLPGVEASDLREWAKRFDPTQARRVRSVSCDMSGTYVGAMRALFPDALLCVDRFHVFKLAGGAVGEERKALARTLPKEEAKELNKAAKLLLKRKAGLDERTPPKARASLEAPGAARLRVAWLALQAFYAWADAGHRSRAACERALKDWERLAKGCGSGEMAKAAKTVAKHRELILNGWEEKRSNAVAEAVSRSIKSVIRDCRGFASFESLRTRLLAALGGGRLPKGGVPLFKHEKESGSQ